MKSHYGSGLKAESLSHMGTVYTEGRNNMHQRRKKLETDNGVFTNNMVLRSRQPVNLAWCATLACSCCTRSQPRGGTLLDAFACVPLAHAVMM